MPVTGSRMPLFRHDALVYAGEQGFLDGTVPFIRDAVAADEPILVVVGREKIERLRAALDGHAARVSFADMAEVGENPARIIPAWETFVSEHPGRCVRGIGEPITASRSPAELVECHRHETLLNVAFAEALGFTLLCPYDATQLDATVIAEMRRTHPHVHESGATRLSDSYSGLDAASAPFGQPLPEPDEAPAELAFDGGMLAQVRACVGRRADAAGMSRSRRGDLVLAVNEVAANSVRHGGGRGRLRVWRDGRALVCEVADGGRIADPLIGRRTPAGGQVGGYGVWMANRLCELVQVRTTPMGSVVRLHMQLP